MSEEIKGCPFCGSKPAIHNTIRLAKECRGMNPKHDIEVSWEIKCLMCGTRKESHNYSYYSLDREGNFVLTPQSYSKDCDIPTDQRQDTIDRWNKRFA